MASYNTVMNMNTKAVSFLIQGNQSDCILTLQDALQIFKRSLNEPSDVEMSASDSSPGWTTQSFELPPVPATCHESFQLFNSAFVFLWENNTEGTSLPESEERIVPAVLLYNLGLCHHREALRRADSDSLRTASRLYSHAMALLETLTDELRDSDMVLCAALANNMAHIASSVFDTKATREFQHMLEDIMAAADMEYLEEEDAEVFFCMNLLMASELHVHGLAPAA
jgi:hypothetical protein